MATGLPTATTSAEAAKDLKMERMVFWLSPKNPEAIAQKVLLLLQDEGLRQRIGERNRRKAKQYTWKGIVAKLKQIYFQCFRTSSIPF
ncbi:unnamed protein product [marine sediment metagenome]|uniref:Glycosyl transferase family 1 domain-containing protein n=1 Tax=marine sediment metagenome TaxID=412755 RepID=X1DI59_9ZZZZ